MNATGIICKIDKEGRIIIPVDIREQLGWQSDTPIEFCADKFTGEITMKKYVDEDGCEHCKRSTYITDFGYPDVLIDIYKTSCRMNINVRGKIMSVPVSHCPFCGMKL